ncbi:MAG: hypothetical protein L0387_20045 [Acidobacteria bacterium]|nr:hypothetical protein [Acidobacteriota bacterium]MCI0722234.1 hypothetical protein [Acidobacteriota bacterium]
MKEINRRVNVGLKSPFVEVDKDSVIEITFDKSKMAVPVAAGARVQIKIEANILKRGTSTPIAPIRNYLSKRTGSSVGSGGAAEGETTVSYVSHIKAYNPSVPGQDQVPSTDINLGGIAGAADADQIELQIINAATREVFALTLKPRPFGFRVGASDSLFFLKRFGIGDADQKNGVQEINFGPAPGVTYGGVYMARHNSVIRFLEPGIGVNASFMNWRDPAFDVTTGRFVQNTTATDVNIGLGIQTSLFHNIIQFTYGANLHATQDRTYFGIGISFIQLGTKIASLVSQ